MPILTFFMMLFIGLGLIWLAGGVSQAPQALGCALDYKGGLCACHFPAVTGEESVAPPADDERRSFVSKLLSLAHAKIRLINLIWTIIRVERCFSGHVTRG